MRAQSIGDFPVVAEPSSLYIDGHVVRNIKCRDRLLGCVYKRQGRRRYSNGRSWRAEHARNHAISFHRTMQEAIDDLVRTERTYYAKEYMR